MAHRPKTQRRRCDNPQCGKQYRFEQTSSSTCSHRCRTALYRQRKAALYALARVLAAAAAKVKLQETIRKLLSNRDQLQANRREAAFEKERERYQQAAQEEALAERSRPRTAPAVDNSTVTISDDYASYTRQITDIPSAMKPGWRRRG